MTARAGLMLPADRGAVKDEWEMYFGRIIARGD
jgi:hypothetical protein